MRDALKALFVLFAFLLVIVPGLLLVAGQAASDASTTETSQRFDQGGEWSVRLDCRDGFGFHHCRVTLLRRSLFRVQPEADAVTLVPWGAMRVVRVAWLDDHTVQITGPASDAKAGAERLVSWGEVAIQYPPR